MLLIKNLNKIQLNEQILVNSVKLDIKGLLPHRQHHLTVVECIKRYVNSFYSNLKKSTYVLKRLVIEKFSERYD